MTQDTPTLLRTSFALFSTLNYSFDYYCNYTYSDRNNINTRFIGTDSECRVLDTRKVFLRSHVLRVLYFNCKFKSRCSLYINVPIKTTKNNAKFV